MNQGTTHRHVFGPVPSRRLGRSLGIDLTPAKTCSLNCRYCQLSATEHPTSVRREFIPGKVILAELKARLAEIEPPDWITFSGTGEPTLHSGLGEIIRGIRALTTTPICVITNGTLLGRQDVRADLMPADRVMPTLCSTDAAVFQQVHRPAPELGLSGILSGLQRFAAEYRGYLEIEVFILPGINDRPAEVAALGRYLRGLARLTGVYLNTAVRPPVDGSLRPATPEEIEIFRGHLGAELPISTVYDHSPVPLRQASRREVGASEILALLERHPCDLEQLTSVLGATGAELEAKLNELAHDGRVERTTDGTWKLPQ